VGASLPDTASADYCYAAGGGNEILARLIGRWLSDRLGQPFIVENRPGAASNIATEAVVKLAPDGYTLLLTSTANAIAATFYERLNFNFVRDIVGIAMIMQGGWVMVVNPSVPAKSVPEFIAFAKANHGKNNFASSGTGAPDHMSGELFKMMAGVDMPHIAYRGQAPALIDLLGGQVQVMFVSPSSAIEHIKAGKLRPLGMTTATRLEVLPGVPSIGEFLPGYETSGWYGIAAPKNTPG
jgi:tripartite-type tricarboxylate transporter receptor subunit TctC